MTENIQGSSLSVPGLHIHYGDLDCLPEVLEVMARSFPPEYGESWNENQCRSMLSLPSAKLLIARIDEDICGFAICRAAAGEEELLLIAIDPAFQQRGIGQELLRHLLEEADKSGVKTVFLEVRADNVAQSLYHKLGFEEIGRRPNYYTGNDSEKFDAVTFKISLENR